MDFSFPPEQIELADSLAKWLRKDYDLTSRRSALAQESDSVWTTLANLGATALMVAPAHGGLGGSASDLYLVLRELGRGLATSPFWSTSVAAKGLEWGAGAELQERLLPQLALGKARVALAFGERDSRHDLKAIRSRLSQANADVPTNQWTLDGEKHVVLFGGRVDYYLVTALTGGRVDLVLVAADANGIERRPYRTLDGLEAADITFTGTPVSADCLLSLRGDGLALVERLADYGASLLCAEAVGLMEMAKDTTLEYLKNRQQFGSPLSKFQALQHRMVDIMIQLEQARSITYLAVAHSAVDDRTLRTRSVAAAKSLVGEASRFVGQQCVQLHGAVGLTDEFAVSHALKRLTMIDLTFGDTDHHLARFAELSVHS